MKSEPIPTELYRANAEDTNKEYMGHMLSTCGWAKRRTCSSSVTINTILHLRESNTPKMYTEGFWSTLETVFRSASMTSYHLSISPALGFTIIK